MWLYGSGFPKSMDLGLAIDKKRGIDNRTGRIKTDGKATNSGSGCYNCNNGIDNSMKKEYEERVAQNEWQGWGTCLKPAYEPIIIARKPFKGSCVDNVLKYGVGGLNIDECRVSFNGEDAWKPQKSGKSSRAFQSEKTTTAGGECSANENGRFPANVILTYEQIDFDEVCGGLPNTKSGKNGIRQSDGLNKNVYRKGMGIRKGENNGEYGDSGSAARYFYCAKASKKDRDEGLDEFEKKQTTDGCIRNNKETARKFGANSSLRANTHPTVKPTSLMQYLIRLVTPKNGIVLDPFMGSGSTGKAVAFENKERQANYKFIGIEKEREYCDIAEARIKFANEIK